MSSNENPKPSEFTYHNKDTNIDKSAYDRLLNSLKKLYTSYNPTVSRMHEPVIEGRYKVTRDTKVVLVFVEHKEEEIQWACSTSISTDAGEPETLKGEMTRPNGYL